MSNEFISGAYAWHEEATYRSAIYRNLSALFADAPSAEALESLIEAADAMEAKYAHRESEESFYRYLRNLGKRAVGDLRTAVASEYAELFVGPRPPLAPLYESVYLGFPNRLFTEQTMSVRRFYERCGLEVVKDGKVPDDHLAYELELMAVLAEREAQALENGNESAAYDLQQVQREFIVVHLGGWTKPFATRIAEADCFGFYAALSRFLDSFVAEEDAYLGASLRSRVDNATSETADNDGRTLAVQN